jgi:hypothetical protein
MVADAIAAADAPTLEETGPLQASMEGAEISLASAVRAIHARRSELVGLHARDDLSAPSSDTGELDRCVAQVKTDVATVSRDVRALIGAIRRAPE